MFRIAALLSTIFRDARQEVRDLEPDFLPMILELLLNWGLTYQN